VGVGALVSSAIYEHLATRNAVDPVKIFKAQALARLMPFFLVGFTFLLMMPPETELNPFRSGTEVKTFEELVPLLERQGEALATMRTILYYFLLIFVIGFGPALYNLFLKGADVKTDRGDSIPR
jgi:hypothetical protein